MWKVVGNVIEMFVYSTIYLLIAMISLKIIGAAITSDFEKKIGDEANLALALIGAGMFVGLALLLSSIVR
jgi:hypothetical protein